MSDPIVKLQAAANAAWSQLKAELGKEGVTFVPWPASLATRRAYRWGHEVPLGFKGEALRFALEPKLYEDKNRETPEELVIRTVGGLLLPIAQELNEAGASIFYVRKDPTVWIRKGDEFGDFLGIAMRGGARPFTPMDMSLDLASYDLG